MNARRSVAFELLAIGVAAVIFVATFRVRPAYIDFALAGLAVVLIAASARRSRRFWDAAPLVPGGGASRRAWIESGMFTGAALLVLIALAAWTAGSATALAARAANWHLAVALPLYFGWGLLQQYIFQRFLFGRLIGREDGKLHLLPLGAGGRQTVVTDPPWAAMAVRLVRAL